MASKEKQTPLTQTIVRPFWSFSNNYQKAPLTTPFLMVYLYRNILYQLLWVFNKLDMFYQKVLFKFFFVINWR